MYVVNDIAYAGAPREDMKVDQVRVVNDYSMLVRFSSGETRLFDAAPLLDVPAFKPLEDKSVFASFQLDHGIVTWNNGAIDIAPEALYEKSYRYDIPA